MLRRPAPGDRVVLRLPSGGMAIPWGRAGGEIVWANLLLLGVLAWRVMARRWLADSVGKPRASPCHCWFVLL